VPSRLLLDGSKIFGAFSLRVDSGATALITIFPQKAGSHGRLSQKVFSFSPLRTFSKIWKKASLAVTRWSKHWATLHWSALGFQLSCCVVKSLKPASVSSLIAFAAEINP